MANLKYKNSNNQWNSLSVVRGPKGDNADIILNGTSSNNISIYAPVSSGLAGQILQSNGANENPTWIEHQMPTVNNAILEIQKNESSLGTFSANASENKIINIEVPTIENSLTSTDVSKALSANQGYILNQKFGDYVLTTALENLVKQYILASHPIGSIEINITGTNPSTYLGGTWIAWGTGRVPVGIDIGDTDFSTVEKTGGSKTHTHTYSHTHNVPGVAHTHSTGNHTLTVAEMPGHSHDVRQRSSNPTAVSSFYNDNYTGGGAEYCLSSSAKMVNTGSTDNLFTLSVGGSGAHNHGNTGSTTPSTTTTNSQSATNTSSTSNIQPYITCYMWKRTA